MHWNPLSFMPNHHQWGFGLRRQPFSKSFYESAVVTSQSETSIEHMPSNLSQVSPLNYESVCWCEKCFKNYFHSEWQQAELWFMSFAFSSELFFLHLLIEIRLSCKTFPSQSFSSKRLNWLANERSSVPKGSFRVNSLSESLALKSK